MTKPSKMNPLAKFADECEHLWREQQITATSPGSILSDIQVMLEFIRTNDLRTKSKRGNLPPNVLPDLNRRLSAPIELSLTRSVLRNYPNVAGLYVLLRVMELVRVENGRLRLDEQAAARWAALNPTEQYFALLEAWLFLAEESVLGSVTRNMEPQFEVNLLFLSNNVTSRWRSFPEYSHYSIWLGGVSEWNAQLQMRFGLIEVQPRGLTDRSRLAPRGWLLGKARRTPWGTALAWALWEFLDIRGIEDFVCNQKLENAGFGTLQPAFQPYFPEWQQVYHTTAVAAPRGVWIVKASLGEVWRRFAVPDDYTLDDLAYTLLEAFRFDDTDHLYEFRFRDARGKTRAYQHPYCDEGPYASEVMLAECGLPEKGTMNFLFDFGDC